MRCEAIRILSNVPIARQCSIRIFTLCLSGLSQWLCLYIMVAMHAGHGNGLCRSSM